MSHTKPLWENYTLDQHKQIIDLAFGMLKKDNVAAEIKTLFEESGIEPYVTARDELFRKISAGEWDDTSLQKLQIEHSKLNIEITKLLQMPLYTRRPLSYKHIGYQDLSVGSNQKFVIFINFTGCMAEHDVVLLTGTGNTLHKDHLRKFVKDVWAGESQDEVSKILETLGTSDNSLSINNMGGGRVKKPATKELIAHSTSTGLGGTSNTTAKIIYEHLFPDHTIKTELGF